MQIRSTKHGAASALAERLEEASRHLATILNTRPSYVVRTLEGMMDKLDRAIAEESIEAPEVRCGRLSMCVERVGEDFAASLRVDVI